MAVSGGYNGALQWMLAHGWQKSDLDDFLARNPGDWGRVDSAFGNDTPPAHSVAAQSDGTHAAPGVVLTAPAPVYAPTTAVGSAPQLMSSPGDGLITASAMLPAVATPGGGPLSVSISDRGTSMLPAASGIPTWAYLVGAAIVLVLLIRR